MTNCKDCKFYQSNTDWNGWCLIDLPRWLRVAVVQLHEGENRFVRADDRCDLGAPK
jgi:hypothetical protein